MRTHPFLQSLAAPFLWLHRRLLPCDTAMGWAPYLWLVWLGFFFIPWALQSTSVETRLATAVALAIFLPLYFRFHWAPPRERLWIIGIIAAMGCAMIPFSISGGGLLIYAGAFVGYGMRPRPALLALAGLAAAGTIEYLWLGTPLGQWLWAPAVTAVVGLANIWGAERHRQHRALQRSQDEVKRLAATAERERIGRDLHDLLGHTLTLITVKAELAARLAERDLPGAAREIREVEHISRNALQQVREAVGGYRSGGLDAELANARAALTSANVSLAEKVDPPRLSGTQESLLAMVLREAVTNVIRHANARHCRIELDRRGGQLQLTVRDDGRGGPVREGNGLRGMRERLKNVAGHLDVTSGRDGTCLSILMPLRNAGAEEAAPATLGGQSA